MQRLVAKQLVRNCSEQTVPIRVDFDDFESILCELHLELDQVSLILSGVEIASIPVFLTLILVYPVLFFIIS